MFGQLRDALASGGLRRRRGGLRIPARDPRRHLPLAGAIQGFTPTDTANFVFSLKEPIFEALKRASGTDATSLSRPASGGGQGPRPARPSDHGGFPGEPRGGDRAPGAEIADELSTPVVRLWDGILALPLIGTLDSARTGVVMENLLQAIVDEEAEIAIIDITGVPTVDTLVAQHLLKTVAAARLMGPTASSPASGRRSPKPWSILAWS